MEHTKLPQRAKILAIYLISHAKTGLSALALKRKLGFSYPSYPTAWLMHQKLNSAMAQHDNVHQLSGFVQPDDAYLGGDRAGCKVGTGSENKMPFVAAVPVDFIGHPRYLKLNLVSGFTRVSAPA